MPGRGCVNIASTGGERSENHGGDAPYIGRGGPAAQDDGV